MNDDALRELLEVQAHFRLPGIGLVEKDIHVVRAIRAIGTCRMNNIDPEAWLRDVPARLPVHPASRISELLPWNWKQSSARMLAA